MWQTMVTPLFEGVLILIYNEEGRVHLHNAARLWIGTFKKFLLLPKNTNTDLIEEMIAIDLSSRMNLTTHQATKKWTARKERRALDELPSAKKQLNYLRGIPNTFCTIVKMQHRVCHVCKTAIMSYDHMIDNHNIWLVPYTIIWDNIKVFALKKEKERDANGIMKIKRYEFVSHWTEQLQKVLDHDNEVLQAFYSPAQKT